MPPFAPGSDRELFIFKLFELGGNNAIVLSHKLQILAAYLLVMNSFIEALPSFLAVGGALRSPKEININNTVSLCGVKEEGRD